VEGAAATGNRDRFKLPRPMKGRTGCDFSFSGLKTAVRHAALALPEGPLQSTDVADLCASFQHAAADSLADRTANAMAEFKSRYPSGDHHGDTLVVAGGVAANMALRQRLQSLATDHHMKLVVPPAKLCTDNGAMIAWAGLERLAAFGIDKAADGLDFAPRPRWPLDQDAAAAAFAGVKA
ncbi:MAG TPA: tRNA (adenosine(37)-N6)-threonylcarbamoyltransferase complex transferase subunit TsaD, partial [Rhodospirillales bacterium]|nr:tRNA (adenosine(37)-N6)-threonylcarbamoyltransferase complex transferase subunit TsaD [Rhodospirillales bacterium]